jgi:adenylate kinase
VAVRLKAYRDQTAPVLDFYERRGLVRRIQGVGGIDEIQAAARRALGVAGDPVGTEG